MKKIFTKILLIIGVLLAGYSYFIEPNKLEVTNYTIQDKELNGIKIVFASDFHIKPYGQKRLEKVVLPLLLGPAIKINLMFSISFAIISLSSANILLCLVSHI